MTAVFGVFYIGNQEQLKADLEMMMLSLVDPQADNIAAWFGETIAFGQKTVNITPESFNVQLPFHKNETNLTITGDIRIDNRAELFTQFGISKPGQHLFSDAELVLFAYLKWNETCPEHLMGDFAFAIWDNERKKLFCCRDHFGKRGLFYYYDEQKFIFATDIAPIISVEGVKSGINPNKLATIATNSAKHLFREESWFVNIFPVPAATILIVDKNGIRKRKYWVPKIGDELVFKSEAEYAEAFKEVFFKAVADRLRSNFPVTALLSGGLDSSAIVSVAAKILEKQNKELQVLSVVLPDQNDIVLTDERYFIDLFRTFPNVKINYITPPDSGFFSYLDKFKDNVNVLNYSSRHFLYEAFSEKAQDLGSRVILDGAGGELGATCYADGFYAEQFWRLHWSRLWKELKARKILAGESLKDNLRSNVLKPFLPGFIVDLVKSKKDTQTATDHYLQPDFEASLRNRIESRGNGLKKNSTHTSPFHRKNQLNLLQLIQNKANSGMDFGQAEYRYPFMDVKLLEFCLAAPVNLKIKNGYKRNLVRTGLDGILPPEIQWRNSKCAFSPDYIRRYKAQLPQVKDFFDNIKPTDPVRAVVDIEKVKNWIKIPMADNETGDHNVKIARDLIPEAVYLICFLRRFKEFNNN